MFKLLMITQENPPL